MLKEVQLFIIIYIIIYELWIWYKKAYLLLDDTNLRILHTVACHLHHPQDQDMVSHKYNKLHKNSDYICFQHLQLLSTENNNKYLLVPCNFT